MSESIDKYPEPEAPPPDGYSAGTEQTPRRRSSAASSARRNNWIVIIVVLLSLAVLVTWAIKTSRDGFEKARRFTDVVPVVTDFPGGTLDGQAMKMLRIAEKHEAEHRRYMEGVKEAWSDRDHYQESLLEGTRRFEGPGAMQNLLDGADALADSGMYLATMSARDRESALVSLGIYLAGSGHRVQGIRVLRRVCNGGGDASVVRWARKNLKDMGEKLPED